MRGAVGTWRGPGRVCVSFPCVLFTPSSRVCLPGWGSDFGESPPAPDGATGLSGESECQGGLLAGLPRALHLPGQYTNGRSPRFTAAE